MLDRDTDYMPIFELAEQFAMSYSTEILVNRSHKEEIRKNGKDYACVPLSFPAKGNKVLYNRIMESGYCTRMDGRIVDGKRIINVLLWIDPDTCNYHKVSGVFCNADMEV